MATRGRKTKTEDRQAERGRASVEANRASLGLTEGAGHLFFFSFCLKRRLRAACPPSRALSRGNGLARSHPDQTSAAQLASGHLS